MACIFGGRGNEANCEVEWDPSLRLLVAVLIPELPYLAPDHVGHMRLHKHVGRIKHVHDEPLRWRHRGVQVNDELRHRDITGGRKTEELQSCINNCKGREGGRKEEIKTTDFQLYRELTRR